MFVQGQFLGIKDARDGTVNTLLFAEIGRNNGDRAFQGGYLTSVSQMEPWDANTGGVADPSGCVTAATPAGAAPGRYPATGVNYETNRGVKWQHVNADRTGFNAILPPNGPSCSTFGNADDDAVLSAGSYHGGGVQAVMVDGSVQFINETIDAGDDGDPNVIAGPSPYGVWGALATRSAGDSTEGAF